MAIVTTDNKYYTEIAAAIREKNGSSDLYTPAQMAEAILALSGGGLPSGFTPLSYIAGTDNQYIDTEFYPNQNTKIEIDFMCTGDISVFGTQNGFANQAFMYASSMACFGNVSNQSISAWSANTRYTVSLSKDGLYRNGVLLWTPTYNEFTAAHTLTIMGNHEGGTVYAYDGRVYGARLFDNGKIICHYIPGTMDGEYGMYDIVNARFSGNAGSGAFTGG